MEEINILKSRLIEVKRFWEDVRDSLNGASEMVQDEKIKSLEYKAYAPEVHGKSFEEIAFSLFIDLLFAKVGGELINMMVNKIIPADIALKTIIMVPKNNRDSKKVVRALEDFKKVDLNNIRKQVEIVIKNPTNTSDYKKWFFEGVSIGGKKGLEIAGDKIKKSRFSSSNSKKSLNSTDGFKSALLDTFKIEIRVIEDFIETLGKENLLDYMEGKEKRKLKEIINKINDHFIEHDKKEEIFYRKTGTKLRFESELKIYYAACLLSLSYGGELFNYKVSQYKILGIKPDSIPQRIESNATYSTYRKFLDSRNGETSIIPILDARVVDNWVYYFPHYGYKNSSLNFSQMYPIHYLNKKEKYNVLDNYFRWVYSSIIYLPSIIIFITELKFKVPEPIKRSYSNGYNSVKDSISGYIK
ncbi:MAG: hypothetical protein H6573_20570 [Lewinellaceae bacterium]|nr:hypothetical protein [Lewinellaceae bacterium]